MEPKLTAIIAPRLEIHAVIQTRIRTASIILYLKNATRFSTNRLLQSVESGVYLRVRLHLGAIAAEGAEKG